MIRRSRRHPPLLLVTVWLGCVGFCAGCAGGGRIELVPMNLRAIDPPAPTTSSLELDRCYWWTDDAGQVWIAMESVRRPLIGNFGPFVFRMSLVLEKLPSGKERDYRVGERELRALTRFGPLESRFTGLAGIVALYRQPNQRLRGSYRIQARQEVSRLLGGWSPPGSCIIQGTFVAVPDPARGAPIAAATESYGWERDSSPPRRPTTTSTAPAADPP